MFMLRMQEKSNNYFMCCFISVRTYPKPMQNNDKQIINSTRETDTKPMHRTIPKVYIPAQFAYLQERRCPNKIV